jgi:pilus assembly protein CpaF
MSTKDLSLEIRRPGKAPESYPLDPGVYTIGSDDDCAIRLYGERVDGRHAILTISPQACWVEDLQSTGGTTIDNTPVKGRHRVGSEKSIEIDRFELIIHGLEAAQSSTATASTETLGADVTKRQSFLETTTADSTAPRPELDHVRSIKQQLHKELVERLDIRRISASRVDQSDLQQKAKSTLERIVRDVTDKLPANLSPERLIKEVLDEALRLGPLEDLLEDDSVTEIMVNGPSQVYVERNGQLNLTNLTFMDDDSVLAIIERIVSPIGRRIDESQPYVDARLSDGSRVNAIIHPLSLVGPCLTIRKFARDPFTVQDLIGFGTLTAGAADFLRVCVRLRKNIIVSGGTGSGKTTFLNVLSSYLPDTERILTIEDAAELRLTQKHVVRLESRPPNIEGRGAITIRDLVRNALRMRPDRIVVGECRSGEALDMLQAMNTGHDGSLTTVHANSPRDVISRLETMVLMSGMDLPIRAIREQVASAVDVIAHESRMTDGSRRITRITEVLGLEGDQVVMQDIFEFKQTGVDSDGKIEGKFIATGSVPTFIEDISTRGMELDRTIFDPLSYE